MRPSITHRSELRGYRWLIVAVTIAICAAFGASAASASTLVDPTINHKIHTLPSTPACSADTGGDVDEEICLYVTNAMTAWHHTDSGPRLSGAGSTLYFTQSNDIAGGWAENYGVYWAGPFCASATWTAWNVNDGNATEQAGPQNGRDKCIGITNGFTFGQRRQVQFWDDDYSASSGEWKLFGEVGSVNLGHGIFRVSNNNGENWKGSPYCDEANNTLSQWVSCGAIGETAYHGVTNTAAASDGIDASRISAGFYVQDYPVAIQVTNALPDSTFIANPPSTPEHAMQDTASTFVAGASAATGHSLWWVGYRQRLGHRNGSTAVQRVRIPLTGTLEPSAASPIREQWHGATVSITALLTMEKNADGTATGGIEAGTSTCTVGETTASGAQAKCEVLAAAAGSPSHPAEVHVRIYN